MTRYALSAVGRDRPGIVAAVTRALLVHGVNIEDSQMAVLGGHFAMMLVLAAADDTDAGALREELEAAAAEVQLASIVLEELGPQAVPSPEPSHVVSVYGIDHPGIVHAVTGALAEQGATITDLRTQLAGSSEEPLYAMLIEVAGPAPDADRLGALAREQGVELTVRELEQDVL
jgi:glycine cleavage system transcriptional repressor